MNIILVTEVIHSGGAETFVLRLAKALQEQGHKVAVFCFYRALSNEQLPEVFASGVPVFYADIPANGVLSKVDSLLFRLKIDIRTRDGFIKRSLKKAVKEHNCDVLHSHLLKVDSICVQVTEETAVPAVTTMHGDYLHFSMHADRNEHANILNYYAHARKALRSLRGIVCISDEQMGFLKEKFARETEGKMKKYYNGYPAVAGLYGEERIREQLGVPETSFVFGMISRGIKAKGWDVAIEAFQLLAREDAHLVLIGGGSYIEELRAKYQHNPRIHFLGQINEPLRLLPSFNVGLLPSTFASESLPTVVIEYLLFGKPVIAADVGEISKMISYEGKDAGVSIPLVNGAVPVKDVAAAMQQYLDNKTLYNEHRENALHCYQQFDMQQCVRNYEEVYRSALA